jgi:hypothetical protein
MGTVEKFNKVDGIGQVSGQEVPTEKVEEGVGETESIKNRSRKDLFPDESEFSDVIGGSGKNSKISSYKEVNGIGISEYKNPDSGVVDVIMTGTSDNDYVGYVRIYENGKPTERWTSKMENKSGNKANFKTMISEVKNLLPANHEYTESTNISLDGIRVYANNLTRGYEILTDKDGNPVTNNVELNGATLEGLKSAKSDREISKLYNKRTGITREEFNSIKERVNELLPNTRLLFNEANGSVIIKLPVLKYKGSNTKSNDTPPTPEVSNPAQKTKQPTVPKTGTTDNPALKDVESTAKALEGVDTFHLVENEGEWKATTKTYRGREIGNWAISNLDKKQQKEYLKIRDEADTYGTKEQAEENLKKLKDFEQKNKEAFERAKQEIDALKEAEERKAEERKKQQKIFDQTEQELNKLSDKEFDKLVELIDEKRRQTLEQRFGDSVEKRTLFITPISEAYHKAKADGSNPELVKAVESLLSKEQPKIATSAIIDEIKSKNLTHVKGKNMGENQALGTFVSTEKGNRYETKGNKAEKVEVDIQNPFVVDNGDFGLVEKRQEILNANRDKFDEFDTVDYQKLPSGKLTVDNLNDTGIKKLAELTTNELKAQGYDGIYFRESDTQEGELVVFDKGKVKFNENNDNLLNQENDTTNTKGKSETKGTDASTESSGTEIAERNQETRPKETGGNTERVIRKTKGTPKARRTVKNPEYKKALSHEPESAEDMVLQSFIGGAKISADIIKGMYRNSNGEIQKRIGLLSKDGFATISEMAHSLWENQNYVFGFEKFDSQEFENAVEGVLNSFFGTKAMVEELNKRFGSDIDAKQAEEYAKYLEFENQATPEQVSEMAEYMETLSDEELQRMADDKENAFADDYVNNAEKVSDKRSEATIKGELKIKEAELKKLEEKQSKLNKQLEQNLKENQLDLLQGAKPQAMFDDKAEQQKIAKSLQDDIDAKRKEVAKLQDELDNINQEEIPFQSTDKKFTPIDKTAFEKLLDKLKKAFPNVKVELFGKGNMESAKKALEKYGVDLDLQSIYNIIGLSVLATSSTSQINQQPLITNAVSDNLNLSDGNVVEINDNRLIDKASGNKITDKNKMSASVTEGDIKKLTLLSNKHGVDPYTMIAMTMQETNFDTGLENPFHYDPQNWEKYKGISEDPMEIAVLVFKDKLKYAERLGKKTEAEKIQAYNGYGKIGKKTDAQKGSSVRSWYGISSSSFPIDMNKTPIYGNRVLDIRDNIIKSNPKIVKLVESQSNNIAFLKTKDGTIYGFKTPDGKVFINTDNLNANTPIHEFGHIWQSVFPQGFARGIEL